MVGPQAHMKGQDVFPRFSVRKDLRIAPPGDSLVRHEIFYEESVTSIREKSLFLGFAFSKKRFFAFGFFAVLFFLGLLMRAVWMQVVQYDAYQLRAERNRLRHLPVWPQRGIIRDRAQVVIAANESRFQILLTPRDLPVAPESSLLVIGQASRLFGMSVGDFDQWIHATGSARDDAYLVADRVPYELAMRAAVALPQLPGFRLEVRPRRNYPFSREIPSLSHVLGYVGRISEEEYAVRRDQDYWRADELGKTGIERRYETRLRGTVGERLTEVDVRNRVKGFTGERSPIDGTDLQLTLDVGLQRATEEAIREGLKTAHAARGSAVVMDPRNGEILSIVSWPAYDNNIFSGGVSSTAYQALIQNPDQPLFARAWAGAYPSGSTVKIVVSVAALMEKIVTRHTTVLSTGGLRVGAWFFPDWKVGGHGTVHVRQAIAWSVNTFFYLVGGGYESFVGLGPTRLTDWMARFGLGKPTGLDISGEAAGFLPTPIWRHGHGQEWYVGDTYNLSIGQGDLLVTPVQVAAYTSAIANRGFRIKPHLLMQEVATSTERLASLEVVETVRQGMRDGVLYGSSRALANLPFSVAGKTGTAQWNKEKTTHAWHTSFAPFNDPEVVVTVLLEEGGEGSSTAVPVARRILEAWWKRREAIRAVPRKL